MIVVSRGVAQGLACAQATTLVTGGEARSPGVKLADGLRSPSGALAIDLGSDAVYNLQNDLTEAVRSTEEGVARFVERADGTLRTAVSRRPHLVFGRRGSGKTSVLRKAIAEHNLDRAPARSSTWSRSRGIPIPTSLSASSSSSSAASSCGWTKRQSHRLTGRASGSAGCFGQGRSRSKGRRLGSSARRSTRSSLISRNCYTRRTMLRSSVACSSRRLNREEPASARLHPWLALPTCP
jgi:hypothetical protein